MRNLETHENAFSLEVVYDEKRVGVAREVALVRFVDLPPLRPQLDQIHQRPHPETSKARA
jgi:hypothetical protein